MKYPPGDGRSKRCCEGRILRQGRSHLLHQEPLELWRLGLWSWKGLVLVRRFGLCEVKSDGGGVERGRAGYWSEIRRTAARSRGFLVCLGWDRVVMFSFISGNKDRLVLCTSLDLSIQKFGKQKLQKPTTDNHQGRYS